MSELENIEENLEEKMIELELKVMRENCFTMLKDFMFYYDLDKKKENVFWTKNDNIEKLTKQMSVVIEEESKKFAEYYEVKSDFAHSKGGSHGHSHTHTHGHTHAHSHVHSYSHHTHDDD